MEFNSGFKGLNAEPILNYFALSHLVVLTEVCVSGEAVHSVMYLISVGIICSESQTKFCTHVNTW